MGTLRCYPTDLSISTVYKQEEALVLATTGDANTCGSTRVQELHEACAQLGIHSADVRCIDDPHLRDGLHTFWPADAVHNALRSNFPDEWSLPDLVRLIHTFCTFSLLSFPKVLSAQDACRHAGGHF